MKIIFNKYICIKKFSLLVALYFTNLIHADNFKYSLYNNHGVVGLINTPSARFFNEEVHGVTLYNGTPDQKVTLSSNPYNWLEASFFYTNIQGFPYPGFEYQDYKDKGFNIKVRVKEEGLLPAVAIGAYDFAGTGYYSSEYIVSSYGIDNFDFSFGIGWGQLSGTNKKINNPLGYLDNRFKYRPIRASGSQGGTFNTGAYFSGIKAAPFYGVSYSLNEKFMLKIEKDTILIDGTNTRMKYDDRKSDFSIGLDYAISDNFSIGASFERGNYLSLKFVYKNDPKKSIKKYEYKKSITESNDDKYTKLIKNLEANGIGVNKISETSRAIGLNLTQFIHPDLRIVEQIIAQASLDAGINKNVKKDINIASLEALKEIDDNFIKNANLVYERQSRARINTVTGVKLRPFIASREEFFKGAILLENDTEFIIRDDLFFNTNLKYSLADNFNDLRFPPRDTFPAQVRSDVKQYLKNMDEGILIGRAQLDYHVTPKSNHHLMFTGGLLEEMFSGLGFEYLYFKPDSNFSFGIEAFKVRKRDYYWRFGHLDYKNSTITANFYYRNYGLLPFDMKISAGEYLAGDVGSTIEFSRKFSSGVNFGIFATFTDVTFNEFGEGSFDKGIFFNIPIYGNLIDYTWRPLTKDPGARLIRRNSLHDLLVRFRPLD
jgi:hypothetical protein